MKTKLSDLKKLFKLNMYGNECPICSVGKSCNPTAKFSLLYDEKYRKNKFYISCRTCKLTTPAFEDPRDAIEFWDYNFILKEDEILLEEEIA